MSRAKRYITNVIWNSLSVGVLLVIGFLLSPYILHHIGDKKYGEWTLAVSLVEYYWLIDLGIRSATVKFSAEFFARDDRSDMSELLSTALVFSVLAGGLVILASLGGASWAARFWHVGQPEFTTLLRIAGVSWGLGMIANVFSGSLEGMQRFDILSRIWMLTNIGRSVGVAVVLGRGYGVLAMGWMLLISQTLSYLAMWISFRRLAPEVRVSWSRGTVKMGRMMANYGVHTLTALVATRLMGYSGPLLIGYLLPIEYLAYWAVPVRIMDYAFDGIGRIGMVTLPSSAELAAKGEYQKLRELGVHANRYCLSLFVPFAAFLLIYGAPVYSLWIKKPEFVQHSLFLVPVLLVGYAVVAGQFNSTSILYGLGKHKIYVRCLLGEAILVAIGMALALPRWGLLGGAWVIACLMILDRGLLVAWLFARELSISTVGYMWAIYSRPVALGGVMGLILWLLKRAWLPGENWFQVAAALVLSGAVYLGLASVLVFTPEHRRHMLDKFAPWLRSEDRSGVVAP